MSDECVNYNCDELNDHLKVDCDEFVNGGLKNLVLLECGHTITDPSNASQITANINSGKAKLVLGVSAEVPLRSPIEVDSPVACEPQLVANYDNTISIYDGNVNANNIQLYDTVFSGHKFAGVIIHECAAEKVSWIDDTVIFTGGLVKPKLNTEFQRFEAIGKWRSKRIPTWHNVPAGIFD